MVGSEDPGTHQGVAGRVGLSIGTIVILTSIVVLLLWIPLRQWPGFGTIADAFAIGPVLDWTINVLPPVHGMAARIGLLIAGTVLNGLGGGLYIGAQLGAGPRDGLMTGFNKRFGVSLRLARTAVEVTAVVVGWLLGGTLGVGTVVYALAIGPVTQFFLLRCAVPLPKAGAVAGTAS